MTPDSSVPQPEQVAAFFQKYRTGLVTLVFTDLVDSTALLHQLGDQAGATFLRRRRQILREVLHGLPEAEEIETAGDSFLLVFAKPSDAVRFALQSQARLRTFSLESRLKVQERMGIHLGEVVISEHETEVKAKDLYGIQLAACARVMSLAVGGQVLLTRGAFDSARQVLKGEDIPGVGGLRWVSFTRAAPSKRGRPKTNFLSVLVSARDRGPIPTLESGLSPTQRMRKSLLIQDTVTPLVIRGIVRIPNGSSHLPQTIRRLSTRQHQRGHLRCCKRANFIETPDSFFGRAKWIAFITGVITASYNTG